jgi:multiple sugar transport system substrate-binding protein
MSHTGNDFPKRRMSRRTFIVAGGAASLAAPAMIGRASAQEARTIRMWTQLSPTGQTGREVVLRKLIKGFQDANPGVTVEVEPQIWHQLSDKFFAAHQTGTAPDVVWLHSPRLVDAIKLGALSDLNALFINGWSKEDVDDLDGRAWRYGQTDGRHYQIMHSVSAIGQFYRVDLFKEAGIDPASLTTWSRFIEAAKKLTVKDDKGTVTRWGFGQAFPGEAANGSTLLNVMLDKDGSIFDDKFRAAWATPTGVEGLKILKSMAEEHQISPRVAPAMSNDDIYDQFNAGRLAMARGSTARLPRAQEALGAEKVSFLPTPSFTEGRYSPTEVVGWSAAVWSGSKHQKLAGDWVAYQSSKEADRLWAMEGGAMPIRRSTIRDNTAFFAAPQNAYLVTAAKMVSETGWFAPPEAGGGFNEGMNRAIQDVLVNNADPMAALKKAEDAFNRRRK